MATRKRPAKKATKKSAAKPQTKKRPKRGAGDLLLAEADKLAVRERELIEELTVVRNKLAGFRMALDAMEGKPIRVAKNGRRKGPRQSGLSEKIYELIRKAGTITVTKLAEQAGMPKTQTNGLVSHLRRMKRIQNVARGQYRVVA